ncbi:hypothetical protein [Kocuria sp. TGY1127_2]|uniref:hypothetical protein n=1 Tax=Kocuria sp. TGY1127_2 TaxID=2711328 RepID=UPI0015BF3C59|nr:hypothetical protein [Kocuria sp. TGY1127_2]
MARNAGKWLRAFKHHPVVSKLPRRTRRPLKAFVKWLINQNNPKTMTVSFTRQAAMDYFRVSRRTVDYWVFRLRFFGLLASIASGRSARYAPKGQPTTDLAPVYTFTIPDPDHKLFGNPDLIDTESIHCTPSPVRESKTSWVKTGTQKISYQTLCARAYARYARQHRASLESKRQQLFPAHAQKAEASQLKHLARCLQHHSPADLRRIALEPILAETTLLFRAGWQIADILHALETRPDGSRWDTSGSGGMRSVQAWLRLRLKAWIKDSRPLIAPSELKAQADTARKAEQARQRAQAAAELKQSAPKDSPARVAVRRKTAIIRCGSEQAARNQHPELFESA